jgi:pullulanase/glycogen debranching enzyme
MMKLGRHVDADGRARVCGLAHALVVLSQGVPFIHAGDDLLRSKSLDRDSYNSGGRNDNSCNRFVGVSV